MKELLVSLRLLVLSMLACCIAYPLLVLGFAQAVVPEQADGSLIVSDKGTVVGSRLLAQSFTQAKYFWPRPSAVNYDAGAAGGSNLSPTNPQITKRAEQILAHFDLKQTKKLPADLVTTSGSGLDPHITLAAARIQVPRVAAARGLPEDEVRSLVNRASDSPTMTRLGAEPLINVLELNLALDRYPKAE